MNTKKVFCNIESQEFHVYDYETSASPEMILDDLSRGMYQLNKLGEIKGPILDIGANIGILSIYFAKKYPESHVHAVEPLTFSRECMAKAIEENEIKNISIHPFAVGGEVKTLEIIAGRGMSGSAHCVEVGYNRDTDVVARNTVKMLTAKELFYQISESKFGLLKIDCEGGEYRFFDLLSDKEISDSFQYIIGEFHGWQAEALVARIRGIIGNRLTVQLA